MRLPLAMKVPALVVTAALSAALLGACGDSTTEENSKSKTVSVEAANGTVAIAAPAKKIVSLSPTATEMLFAIGAGDQVVAADALSNFPSDAPKTDMQGMTPNVDAILNYEPDLVVLSFDPGTIESQLKKAKVPVLVEAPATSLADSYDQIQDLGIATGKKEEASDVVQKMTEDIDAAVKSAGELTERSYYHESDATYYSATSKTFVGEIYSKFKLKNIADEADTAGTGYPQLSAEHIVNKAPDFIFLADTASGGQTAQTVAARPGWNTIPAVQNGKVVELNEDISSRWGPRTVEFAVSVSTALKG
ncbi:MAG: ABC transporter substrate-binding protein [Corynebacteriales bacterium]|nr:ABC transporter substrate-binding protein [Mycobacteriales bacterium]